MVVDRLENLEKYASLNPLFAQAIEFLQSHDLNAMEVGKTELKGKDLVVNVAQTTPKAKEQAKLETQEKIAYPLMLPTMQRKILLSSKDWLKLISL